VEWLHVVDWRVEYCQGCFTCLRTGTCPIADDVPAIRERLLNADGIVVGSPVYGDGPTALLKTLLDRLTLLNLYTRTFEGAWSVASVAMPSAVSKPKVFHFSCSLGPCARFA